MSNVYDAETEIKTLGARIKRSINFKKKNKTYLPPIPKYGFKYSTSFKIMKNNKPIRFIEKDKNEQLIILLINKLYHGCLINEVENILFKLTKEKHILYNKKDHGEKITKIEFGNYLITDIARFLDTVPILRRTKSWSGISVSQILNNRKT